MALKLSLIMIGAAFVPQPVMGGKKNPLGEVIKEISDKNIVMDTRETKQCVKILQDVSNKCSWGTSLS